jgi:RNA polymerase sigma-70 factor, ECF subfamily
MSTGCRGPIHSRSRREELNGSMAADTNPPDDLERTPAPAGPGVARHRGGRRTMAKATLSLAHRRPTAAGDAVGGDVDEDHGLVHRAQRGDRAAFAQLFKKHHGRVRAMCLRLLGAPAEAEDAVQQTFLEAWRCLPRFEGRSRFTTWITRVAIHTCFSTRRRLRRLWTRDSALEDGASFPMWAEPGLPADEIAARRARERAVGEVLRALSPKKRAVFVLADLEGLTSTEIALVLEIPDATVRTRLFHARRAVAALVRKHPGFVDVLAGRGRSRGEER